MENRTKVGIGICIGVIVISCLALGFSAGWHYTITILAPFDIAGTGEPQFDAMLTVKVIRDGRVIRTFSVVETVTLAFKNYVRDVLGNQTFVTNDYTVPFKYIAIGTGSGTLTESDTALESEFDRQIGTYAEPENYNFTITYTWAAGSFSGQNITQYGLFNDASDGTPLDLYGADSGVVLQSTDSLQVEYKVMCDPS